MAQRFPGPGPISTPGGPIPGSHPAQQQQPRFSSPSPGQMRSPYPPQGYVSYT